VARERAISAQATGLPHAKRAPTPVLGVKGQQRAMDLSHIKERVRSWLRKSTRIHAREDVANTPTELINLIDRFMENKLQYELEWDDFISWRQDNWLVEEARNSIGEFESFLFSKELSARKIYMAAVVRQRNKIAAIIGASQRWSFGDVSYHEGP